MSGTFQYFDIYDDGTGVYSDSVIAQVTTNLQQGLIAYEEPDMFSLTGTDGTIHKFQNNQPFQPIAPATPIPTPPPTPPPTPIVLNPATPIDPDHKPTNNNISGSSSTDISLIAITALFGGLWYYKTHVQ